MLALMALIMTTAQQQPDTKMVPAYMDAMIRKMIVGHPPSEMMKEETKAKMRHEALGMLGLDPMPEKTPLNPKITGKLDRDGYVIEKLIYETYPKFYCTAYLYIPKKGTAPYPVVLAPVGHWAHKKLEPVVQARCIGLALYGFAVLCIDMPGQVGHNDDERDFPGPHSDWRLHMASLPPEGVMVWDVVRGIDYLETRPEFDTKRMAVTGASGGGLTSMYAFAVEPRISMAIPVCYPSSYEDNYGNGCYCNHVPGAFLLGDRSDVLAIAAPKPVLVIGAETDAEFPKEGTLRTHAKLLKLYEAYGKPDDCQVLIAQGGHDYRKPMRERMYGFVLKHLMGIGDGGPAKELRELADRGSDPPMNVEDWKAPASQCFPDGKPYADARTMLALAREKGAALAAKAVADAKGDLRGYLAQRMKKIYPEPARVPVDGKVTQTAGQTLEQITGSYVSEPGLRIPFVLSRRPGGKLPARIILAERGYEDGALPAEGGPHIDMTITGRGFGNIPGLDQRLATYVGRPDVIMWAWDVSRAVDYLASRDDVEMGEIEVWGYGPGGGQVAYLAAIMDSRIKRAFGQKTLRSYLDVFDREDLPGYAMPHRILEVGDLPLMRKAVGGDKNAL
jgi:dienelactone hydrolase